MEFRPTELPGVLIFEPKVFGDARGFFCETYRESAFREAGVPPLVQENLSGSRRGVLRGLHYQIQQPQGKFVGCTVGEIFDVAVDIRRSSPNFGRSVCVRLSAENRRRLWVPTGFAHGFLVLSEWAEVAYKVSDYWAPAHERTLLWSDPTLGIAWPLAELGGAEPTVSAKDAVGRPLSEIEVYP